VAGPSVELLQRIPLFAELEPRELGRLSGSFKERTFEPGESVVAEGEHVSRFFVIESGEAVSELKCYGLTFWDFRPLIESDARIAWPLLQAMAKRLRAAEADA